MPQHFDVAPIDATFGAVVTNLTLASLDEAAFRALYATWLDHALLIFPGQFLTREQQIAFARRFGNLEFEMAAISNVKSDGTLRREQDNDDVVKILKGNMGWHADSTYMPVQAKGAVFSAEVVPKARGETGWADMRAAYDGVRLRVLATIVETTPNGYRESDARFLAGEILFRQSSVEEAMEWWRPMMPAAGDTYAGAARAIKNVIDQPGPLNKFELWRILSTESARWAELNYNRMKQFGYRCDSY